MRLCNFQWLLSGGKDWNLHRKKWIVKQFEARAIIWKGQIARQEFLDEIALGKMFLQWEKVMFMSTNCHITYDIVKIHSQKVVRGKYASIEN